MITWILIGFIAVLLVWIAVLTKECNKQAGLLREARLERDRAESRMRICEQASEDLREDYDELVKECAELKERIRVAEGKLSRKGLGTKGSKKE